MPQHDVYRTRDGDWVLDCQADVLRDLNSRLVVPLVPMTEAPAVSSRLNPTFDVLEERRVMKTHFAATIPVRELIECIGSLAHERYAIQAAFDMLISGF